MDQKRRRWQLALLCFFALVFPEIALAGGGPVRGVILAVLEELGITSGGVYTPGGGTHNLLDGSTVQDSLAGSVVRGDVVIGNATPKWSRLAKGAALEVLKMNAGGTDPEWAADAGAAAHDLLDGSTVQDSVAQAVTRGSIPYGNATPKWDELAKGADNSVLACTATDVAYETLTSLMDSAFGGTQGQMLYRNGSAWVILGVGSAGEVVTSGGAAANLSWTVKSAGIDTSSWTAWAFIAAPTNGALVVTRGIHNTVVHDDTTDQTSYIYGVYPNSYDNTSDTTVTIHWTAETAVAGDTPNSEFIWKLRAETIIEDGQDIDSESWAAYNEVTDTAAAVSGDVSVATLTLSAAELDTAVAGAFFVWEVGRKASDGSDDGADNGEIVRAIAVWP